LSRLWLLTLLVLCPSSRCLVSCFLFRSLHSCQYRNPILRVFLALRLRFCFFLRLTLGGFRTTFACLHLLHFPFGFFSFSRHPSLTFFPSVSIPLVSAASLRVYSGFLLSPLTPAKSLWSLVIDSSFFPSIVYLSVSVFLSPGRFLF